MVSMRNAKQDYSADSHLVRIILIASVLIFSAGIMMWYENIHKNPSNVFWAMVDNNLSIYGVSKTIEQSDKDGVGFKRLTRISFAPEFIVESQTNLQQQVRKEKTAVVTRSITKNNKTVSSYKKITASNEKNTKKLESILGKWFTDDLSKDQIAETVGLVPGYVAGSPPFLNIEHQTRQKLVEQIKNNEVYKVNYSGVKRSELSGKNTFEYEVSINVERYLLMLGELSKSSGIDISPVNIDDYKSNPDLQLLMTVSVNGRQLLKVVDKQTGREELFSGYGAISRIDLPAPDIAKNELEKIFKKISP